MYIHYGGGKSKYRNPRQRIGAWRWCNIIGPTFVEDVHTWFVCFHELFNTLIFWLVQKRRDSIPWWKKFLSHTFQIADVVDRTTSLPHFFYALDTYRVSRLVIILYTDTLRNTIPMTHVPFREAHKFCWRVIFAKKGNIDALTSNVSGKD